MSTWTALWILVGVACVGLGFCWRMGYELRKAYLFFSRFRRLTAYGLTVNLEASEWSVVRLGDDYDIKATGSYPRILRFMPLIVVFDAVSVTVRDDRELIRSPDDMLKTLNTIAVREYTRVASYARGIGGWSMRFFHPLIQVSKLHLEYMFEEQLIKGTFGLFSVDMMKARCGCDLLDLSVVGSPPPADSVFSMHVSPLECVWDVHNHTLEVSSDVARFEYSMSGLDKLNQFFRSTHSSLSPAFCSFVIKLNWLVRQSVEGFVVLERESIRTEFSLGSGMFVSLCFDWPSHLQAFSFHNLTSPGERVGRNTIKASSSSISVSLEKVPVLSIQAGTLNIVLDGRGCSGINSSPTTEWTMSVRSRTLGVSIAASSDGKLIDLKSVAVNGSRKSGMSVFASQMDIDASERLLLKLARNYNKIKAALDPLGNLGGGMLVSSRLSSSSLDPPPPSVARPPFISDLNFLLLQRKFNRLAISETSPMDVSILSNRSLAPSGFAASPDVSTLSSSNESSQLNISGNWRSVERMMMQSGKTVFHVGIEKVFFRTGVKRGEDFITTSAIVEKVTISSKISSLGSPFTSVTADVLSVNSNIVSSSGGGGFRFWIDGAIAGASSRVFCLIPPMEIRFDPQFAAALETYFLQVAGVLKLISKSAGPRKFIDFLQISSLQLELHAKEMLGVLSLDNAVIKLNRSSVYKSHGLADALDALVCQYREELKGQWLNLVMHLDVAIGRPVNTARKILTGIIGGAR